MSGNRATVYLALVAAMLVAAAAWCRTTLADSRAAARAAADDLSAARQSAARIEATRRDTAGAGGLRPERELRRRVDEAAERAGVAREGLETIQEQAGRRVGNTGYEERPTQVVVRGVSLRQAVTFLHAVVGESPGVTVRNIHLNAPREQEVTDRWTAEATLTCLAPAARRAARGAGDGGAE